jgi:Putative zinc-finger
MNTHAKVRLMLYEYVKNELSAKDRPFVDAHLASCAVCVSELHEMEETLQVVTISPSLPSDERTEEYWHGCASTIVEAATGKKHRHRNSVREFLEWIEHIRLVHADYVYAFGGAVAVCLAVLTFWTLYAPSKPDYSSLFQGKSKLLHHVAPDSSGIDGEQSGTMVPARRIGQYFRRSKTLLVGLANLKTEPGDQLDFSTERRVSRDLIREARYLKQQPIDPRSRRLMNELERILIELENIKQDDNLPNVEIIRSGIHHENLLFKIRMAEAMYDSSNILFANERK